MGRRNRETVMPIPFQCPECGTQGSANDFFAGRKGKCRCGNTLDFTAAVTVPDLLVGRMENGKIVDKRTGLDRRVEDTPGFTPERRSGKDRRDS